VFGSGPESSVDDKDMEVVKSCVSMGMEMLAETELEPACNRERSSSSESRSDRRLVVPCLEISDSDCDPTAPTRLEQARGC